MTRYVLAARGRPRKNYAGSTDFLARFWARVSVGADSECWTWQAFRFRKGYGSVPARSKRNLTAHRVAFEIATGIEIPPGGMVCHSCDNPPCCNPRHLSLGTNSTNMIEAVERRRQCNARKDECSNGHAFSPENTRWHRRTDGSMHRICRACARDYQRRRTAQRRAVRLAGKPNRPESPLNPLRPQTPL